MGVNPENLPVGGGGPQKAILKKIAAAHRELATLFTALANAPTPGVRAGGAGKGGAAKRKR